MEGIRFDERIKKHIWFNSIVLLHPSAQRGQISEIPWNVTYGDFSEINNEDVLMAQEVMDQEFTKFSWQKNDVMLIDNMISLHARNSFVPPRRILATIIQ